MQADLFTSASVVQHHIGNRLDAVRVQYFDAPAQVLLRPVGGVEALVLPRQVSLHAMLILFMCLHHIT